MFGSCLLSRSTSLVCSDPFFSETCSPVELMGTGSCRAKKTGYERCREQDTFPYGFGAEKHTCRRMEAVLVAESQAAGAHKRGSTGISKL